MVYSEGGTSSRLFIVAIGLLLRHFDSKMLPPVKYPPRAVMTSMDQSRVKVLRRGATDGRDGDAQPELGRFKIG